MEAVVAVGQIFFRWKKRRSGLYKAELTLSPCLYVRPLITAITATLRQAVVPLCFRVPDHGILKYFPGGF